MSSKKRNTKKLIIEGDLEDVLKQSVKDNPKPKVERQNKSKKDKKDKK